MTHRSDCTEVTPVLEDRARRRERSTHALGAAVLVIAVGCGELSNHADSAVDGAPPIDAAPPSDAPPRRCDPQAPFGTPLPIGGVNTTADEFNAALGPDERSILFARNPGEVGQSDLYFSARVSAVDPFDAPIALAPVNQATTHELHPQLTGDGKHLYLVSNRPDAVGGFDIYETVRTGPAVAFPTPIRAPAVNSASTETGLHLLDGRALWFTRDNGGQFDIYRAPISSGTLGVPALVPGLDAGTSDGWPVVTADELTVFFRSDRGGDSDVYVTTRASTADAFGAATRIDALASSVNDEPSWLSPDGCVIVISSNRAGSYDLYVARRP